MSKSFRFVRMGQLRGSSDTRTPAQIEAARIRRAKEDAEVNRQVARVALGHRVAKTLHQRGIIWQ